MDQLTNTDLDQTDEEILTCMVSDEALEAAGGSKGKVGLTQTLMCQHNFTSVCATC